MSLKVIEMENIITSFIDNSQDFDNIDISTIQSNILRKLDNMNISTLFFFDYLNKELINRISLIKTKNLELSSETYQYFYNASHIFIYIKYFCKTKDLNTIMSQQNIKSLLDSCLSTFNCISTENNYNNNLLTRFLDCIFLILNNILDINNKFVLEQLLNTTDKTTNNTALSTLIKKPNGRKFIYEVFKRNNELNISTNSKLAPVYKEKQEELGNYLLLNLCETYKNDDIQIILNDLKTMINIFISDINKIKNNLSKLLIKVFESYAGNDDDKYFEDFLSFCFDEIVFNGNDKSRFNKEFINILFDLYTYLINNINNKKIYILFLDIFFSAIYITDGTKIKYTWLLQETNYAYKILCSFPKFGNEKIVALYFGLLTSLSLESKGDQYYLPEYDLILFFSQLKTYLSNSDQKDNLLKLISTKIYALMNSNKKIIDILLNKCNLFRSILSIIDSKEFENEKQLKLNLLELIEKILSANVDGFNYELNLSLREEINEINLKINELLIEFECDNNIFNNKINKVISILNNFTQSKKIYEFIKLSEVISKSIVNYKFKNINYISEDSLNILNNLFLQISFIFDDNNSKNNDKIEEYLCEFIDIVFKFVFELNKKIFDYKISSKNPGKLSMLYIKKIINITTMKEILTKFLTSENLKVRTKAFNYLINYAVNSKIKIIISPWIFYIMTKILFEARNYENLSKIYIILLECINTSNISVKILLNFDFISITINILEESVINDKIENEEFIIILKNFLGAVIKYLNSELLMKYLQNLFLIYNKFLSNNLKALQTFDQKLNITRSTKTSDNTNDENLISFQLDVINDIHEESNDNIIKINDEINSEKKNKLCFELFNLIKINILNYYENQNLYENNYNYIVLSNTTFPCHLIYNLLFVDNLKFNKDNDSYILFKLFIKITNYDSINGFYLYKFQNGPMNLEIFLTSQKELIIREKNGKNMEILKKIPNFDKILPADSKFHDFLLIFNIEEKCFTISVDSQEKSQKIKYKNIDFSDFKFVIGFTYNSIVERENCNNNYCFIYISYFLVMNCFIENEKLNRTIEKNRYESINDNLLTKLFKDKNGNICKNVITEINFKNSDIHLTNPHTLKNKSSDLREFITLINGVYINNLIPFIQATNPFNEKNRFTKLYMLSKTKNIYEYYLYNYFFELETLHKETICSLIFDNYNLVSNCCNYYVIDFLIGFIYLTEKNLGKIKNSGKNENYIKNQNISVASLYSQQSEDICVNQGIFIEYLLIIFEIIFNIPDNKVKDYFLYENKIQMKIKMFFYRNITLLNNEKFVENLIKIILNKKNTNKITTKNIKIFLNLITDIFFDFIIYEKLEFSIQNIILNHLNEILNDPYFYNEQKIEDILFTLFKNLINITLCCKLTYIEKNQGKTHLDLILDCIFSIANKLIKKNKEFEEKTREILLEIKNTCSQFSENVKTHPISEFLQQFQDLKSLNENINNGEINDNYLSKNELLQLYNQINFISQAIDKFFNTNKISSSLSNDIIILDCHFCNYLKTRFYNQVYLIFKSLKFEKKITKYFRNLYLNFENLCFDKVKYSWFISQKESYNKLQNKLFLKENHIKGVVNINPMTSQKPSYYYDSNEKQYLKLFQQFHLISLFDKLCLHKNFINYLYPKSNQIFSVNCLYINKLHKILSIFVLYENKIKIYLNFFLNNNNKIKVALKETNHILWTKQKNDYEKELANYIKENNDIILEEIYTNTNLKSSGNKIRISKLCKTKTKFGYNNSYKFGIKTIELEKITEIHKRKHLHIPNSLEIFTENGASYFIVTPMDKRDIIFEKIIQKINDNFKKKNEIDIRNIKNANLNDMQIYFKYCPLYLLKNDVNLEKEIKKSKKKSSLYNKGIPSIIDGNILLNEVYNFWLKNKISNFDYLTLLNVLSGRSLNDISQYFIFPWIIKDFDKNILNWASDSIYRDLSLPLHAFGKEKEELKNKYKLLDEDKYFCGTFYSTHAFVAYYLLRQHPFTEVHLEIQGATFDDKNRLFNEAEELSNIEGKCQELIPSVYYLPELYIKINSFNDNDKIKEPIEDFDLPYWSKNDPRKFTLILLKMLENKKISQKLNLWIDLIFGNKQKGQNAINHFNVFRSVCYEFTKHEIEKLDKAKKLEGKLFEKEEMGLVANQLFLNSHKPKEILNEFSEYSNMFFDTNMKLRGLKLIKIENENFNRNKIHFQNIEDIIFDASSELYIKKINYYHQGGIFSLRSVINSFNKNYSNQTSSSKRSSKHMSSPLAKIKNLLDIENNFVLLNKNFKILGSSNIIVTFDNNYIELIDIINNNAYFYYLNEGSEITSITANEKGTYLYVGFNLGFIFQYKILRCENNINIYSCSGKKNIISPFHFISKLTNETFEYNNIYKSSFNGFTTQKEIKTIHLQKILKNHFTYNNPHISKKIIKLSLNEAHNILIAIDITNTIYIISLSKKFCLMHIIHYLTNITYKIKEIIPLQKNGDFIIYTPLSVYLFSINGIPLCQLSLLDKVNESLSEITCCTAVFLYDVILFTGHKDGYIIIWRISNKDTSEKFDERVSFVYNKTNSKFFLSEYNYGYNSKDNKEKINEYELQRKFEIISTINIDNNSLKSLNFMKINSKMDYMLVIDNNKNLYILSNFDKINEKSERRGSKIIKGRECSVCQKEIIDDFFRPTLFNDEIGINGDTYMNENNDNNIIMKKKNSNIICEECKQKLEHTENFLYDY